MRDCFPFISFSAARAFSSAQAFSLRSRREDLIGCTSREKLSEHDGLKFAAKASSHVGNCVLFNAAKPPYTFKLRESHRATVGTLPIGRGALRRDEPVHCSSFITAVGAASIGAVVALIVADRIVRSRPSETRTRLFSAVWVLAHLASVTVVAAWLAGLAVLPWLAAGMTMGGLTRLTVLKAWHRLP